MADEIPMFPLGLVLFPGAYLPLHVFEPRYRELVQVCLASTPEFGVALIERGSDVGGGDARFDVGCVARIVAAARLGDGRWAITTVGTRRIRVRRWLADAPYPRAEVEDWDDPSPGPHAGELRAVAEARLRRALALSAELGEAVPDATTPLGADPLLAGYQMAALAPLGALDQLALLRAETPDARLELLVALVDEEAAVLARRLEGG
ncbi:MAG: LON peptidase substrate-binding domain-containing protein [Actinobacteria bacterium]|nr:LON peptidase substrate-binding domain-containing protein [Actinomycetota bacterium]